jgi:hypothetical protein
VDVGCAALPLTHAVPMQSGNFARSKRSILYELYFAKKFEVCTAISTLIGLN